jgi:UDP-glucose 4-epimerase
MAKDIYTRSKLINENIVLASGGAVARLSNLYGIGMSKNNVLSDIIAQIPGPGSLIVHDSSPVRDFLNIRDVCVALTRFAVSKYSGILNIASGHGTSVHRLVEIALVAAGQADRKVVSTKLVASFSSNILDIDATRTILNWKPEVDLVSGLTELVFSKMESNHGQ